MGTKRLRPCSVRMDSKSPLLKLLAIASLAAAFAACGDRNETEDLTTAVEPAPENKPSAAEIASGKWFYKESNGYPWAGFGPPRSEAIFVIACRNGQVLFQRSAREGGEISIQLSEGKQEINMTSAGSELPMMQGALPANHPFVKLILDTESPIRVVSENEEIVLPTDAAYRRVINACLENG